MTRLTECPPCKMGDHKRHYRVVQPVPEGMMGGAICDCKGECTKDRAERAKRYYEEIWGWRP